MLYLDDLALVAETRSELQHILEVLEAPCTRWDMCISVSKLPIIRIVSKWVCYLLSLSILEKVIMQ